VPTPTDRQNSTLQGAPQPEPGADPPFRIALYRHNRDNLPEVVEVTFAELAKSLSVHRRTPCVPCPGGKCQEKNGSAFSPVEIEGSRRGENVRALTAGVFDLDHLTPELWEVSAALLERDPSKPNEDWIASARRRSPCCGSFRACAPGHEGAQAPRLGPNPEARRGPVGGDPN